jgi:putative transposase
MRFRFVAAERAAFPVCALCRVVGASASGFYAWLRRRPGCRARDDDGLARRIAAILAASRRTYGSPRVHAELRAQGVRVGRKRVERLMRAAGLAVPITRRRIPRTTDSRHGFPVAPNLPGRRFAADHPDTVWLADISYVPTGEGWLYLAAVRDLATREIVGWSMADHLRADLACDALLMAIRRRQPPRGLLHHSDRGVQGGFKRSSQHLERGGCDGRSKAAFRSVGPRHVALAGSALRGAAGGSSTVLDGGCSRTLE